MQIGTRDIALDAVAALCRRWRIHEMSLFGSAVRGEVRPDSDVDVLVEFSPSAEWSSFDLVDLRDELIQMFGRPVDLVEKAGLRNPYRRREILATRKVLYAA